MAKLNNIEGKAHVEAYKDSSDEFILDGYFLTAATGKYRQFDIAGPQSTANYDGPASIDEYFYLVLGIVQITRVEFLADNNILIGQRIDFSGKGKLKVNDPILITPDDYLP